MSLGTDVTCIKYDLFEELTLVKCLDFAFLMSVRPDTLLEKTWQQHLVAT